MSFELVLVVDNEAMKMALGIGEDSYTFSTKDDKFINVYLNEMEEDFSDSKRNSLKEKIPKGSFNLIDCNSKNLISEFLNKILDLDFVLIDNNEREFENKINDSSYTLVEFIQGLTI